MGIDRVIVLDFVKEMAELSPSEFIDMLAEHCRLRALICGFDFHYGKFGSGSVETLKAEAAGRFDVVVIEAVNDQEIRSVPRGSAAVWNRAMWRKPDGC